MRQKQQEEHHHTYPPTLRMPGSKERAKRRAQDEGLQEKSKAPPPSAWRNGGNTPSSEVVSGIYFSEREAHLMASKDNVAKQPEGARGRSQNAGNNGAETGRNKSQSSACSRSGGNSKRAVNFNEAEQKVIRQDYLAHYDTRGGSSRKAWAASLAAEWSEMCDDDPDLLARSGERNLADHIYRHVTGLATKGGWAKQVAWKKSGFPHTADGVRLDRDGVPASATVNVASALPAQDGNAAVYGTAAHPKSNVYDMMNAQKQAAAAGSGGGADDSIAASSIDSAARSNESMQGGNTFSVNPSEDGEVFASPDWEAGAFHFGTSERSKIGTRLHKRGWTQDMSWHFKDKFQELLEARMEIHHAIDCLADDHQAPQMGVPLDRREVEFIADWLVNMNHVDLPPTAMAMPSQAGQASAGSQAVGPHPMPAQNAGQPPMATQVAGQQPMAAQAAGQHQNAPPAPEPQFVNVQTGVSPFRPLDWLQRQFMPQQQQFAPADGMPGNQYQQQFVPQPGAPVGHGQTPNGPGPRFGVHFQRQPSGSAGGSNFDSVPSHHGSHEPSFEAGSQIGCPAMQLGGTSQNASATQPGGASKSANVSTLGINGVDLFMFDRLPLAPQGYPCRKLTDARKVDVAQWKTAAVSDPQLANSILLRITEWYESNVVNCWGGYRPDERLLFIQWKAPQDMVWINQLMNLSARYPVLDAAGNIVRNTDTGGIQRHPGKPMERVADIVCRLKQDANVETEHFTEDSLEQWYDKLEKEVDTEGWNAIQLYEAIQDWSEQVEIFYRQFPAEGPPPDDLKKGRRCIRVFRLDRGEIWKANKSLHFSKLLAEKETMAAAMRHQMRLKAQKAASWERKDRATYHNDNGVSAQKQEGIPPSEMPSPAQHGFIPDGHDLSNSMGGQAGPNFPSFPGQQHGKGDGSWGKGGGGKNSASEARGHGGAGWGNPSQGGAGHMGGGQFGSQGGGKHGRGGGDFGVGKGQNSGQNGGYAGQPSAPSVKYKHLQKSGKPCDYVLRGERCPHLKFEIIGRQKCLIEDNCPDSHGAARKIVAEQQGKQPPQRRRGGKSNWHQSGGNGVQGGSLLCPECPPSPSTATQGQWHDNDPAQQSGGQTQDSSQSRGQQDPSQGGGHYGSGTFPNA